MHNLFIRTSKSLHSSISINTIVFQVMRNITDKEKTAKVTALYKTDLHPIFGKRHFLPVFIPRIH